MEPASLEGRARETVTEGPRAEEAESRVLFILSFPFILQIILNVSLFILLKQILPHPLHFFVIVACSSALGFPDGTSGREPTCQCRRCKEMPVQFLGQEDPLEAGMATHSSILA